MTQSCVSTSATSSLRLNPLVISSANPISSSKTRCLSLPFDCRKLTKRCVDSKNVWNSSVKARYSGGSWDPKKSPRQGIWSIRDDIELPPSMYSQTNAQGPSPMVQSGFQSVISRLFEQRIVRLVGAVDDDSANTLVAQLLYLDALDPNKDIIMYINSPGGSVTAGMAIFDTMRHIRPDVSTVCVGLAASMGAFLLCAGTKGKRYSLPNSRIMIHQPLGGAQGSESEINVQVDEMVHHKINLTTHMAQMTGQNLERLYNDTEKDNFMSPNEALAYGVVDGVISNPFKVIRPQAASADQ